MSEQTRNWKPWAVSGVAILGMWMYFARNDRERQPTPLPIILRQVQEMGELRTTKYTYDNVFEYQTMREPAEWARPLPGMTSLVRNTTRNTALVSAIGSIEAGVDLKKASIERRGTTLVVTLPPAKLQEPNVRAQIHWNKSGMFWDDRSLALKAEQDAGNRFREASLKQGILQEAERSAKTALTDFLKPIAGGEVEVQIG